MFAEKAIVRHLESMGYSVNSSGPGHYWVDGACGYQVCSANTKAIACRNALALIARERKKEKKASWYLTSKDLNDKDENGIS